MSEPEATHECVFVEEREPTGRLILGPCLTCGLTALDALEQLRNDVRQLVENFTYESGGLRFTSLNPGERVDDLLPEVWRNR